MPFIPHTPSDTAGMLRAIGAGTIDELFDEIPKELRCAGLEAVPEALSELEIGRLMRERAARDEVGLKFLGAGARRAPDPGGWLGAHDPRRIL